MTGLVEWLTAQLDADYRVASKAEVVCDGWGEHGAETIERWVLRTISAHRAILGHHKPVPDSSRCSSCWEQEPDAIAPVGHDMGQRDWPCPDVRSLAAIYRSRPGFDPSWIPEDR